MNLTATPAVVTPRETVTATVAGPLETVTAASLEWGYTNFYRYQQVDRTAPSAGVSLHDGVVHDAEDWICVTRVELPLEGGQFNGGGASFRVPSWAPASSAEIVRWSCRLVVSGGGHDIDTHAEFTVRTGRDQFADEAAMQEPVSVSAGAAQTLIDITVPTPVFIAGEVIRGHLILTPTTDLPDGDLEVSWQKQCESHPMQRTPAASSVVDGPTISVGQRIPLRAGEIVQLPFEIPVPDDAPPTATAVNSSITWYVRARMSYTGDSGPLTEQVLKPIFVVGAE